MTDTREQLLQDLTARATAAETALATAQGEIATLTDRTIPENMRTFVSEYLSGLTDADPIVRKMRFGAESNAALVGSKFARWNYSLADVEFLHDLMTARMAQGKRGPSEELQKAFNAISEAHYLTDAEIRVVVFQNQL